MMTSDSQNLVQITKACQRGLISASVTQHTKCENRACECHCHSSEHYFKILEARRVMSHTDHARKPRGPKAHDVTLTRGKYKLYDIDKLEWYWPWYAQCNCGVFSGQSAFPLYSKRHAQAWRRAHEAGEF